MCAVYSNAKITLAVTRSPNSMGGCFGETLPEYYGHSFRSENASGSAQQYFVRKTLPHFGLGEYMFDTGYVLGTFPLLERAWVHQERLLSHRVLHFGPQELIWECFVAYSCECSGVRLMIDPAKRTHTPDFKHGSLDDIAIRWHRLVCQYSGLKLTFPSDRLPAISGLAKQFQKYRSDRYLAGLWEDTFKQDLLWNVSADHPPPRSQPWRAPTWSWASVDCKVNFMPHDKEGVFQFSVEEVSCTPAGPDPTGPLSAGYAVLFGSLAPVSLLYPSPESEGSIYDFQLNTASGSPLKFWADYLLNEPGDGHMEPGSTLYLLKCSVERGFHRFIILRAMDSSPDVYERVGVVCNAKLGIDFEDYIFDGWDILTLV